MILHNHSHERVHAEGTIVGGAGGGGNWMLTSRSHSVAASHALALLVAFSCYWLGSLSSVTLDVHPSPVGCIHVGALEMLGTQKGTKLPQNS